MATVREWARAFPSGSAILDLGCGSGVPISAALVEMGHRVFGIDASPRLVQEFRRNLPDAPVACEPVESSPLFGRTFDAVVAWGLMFLLTEADQRSVITNVARVLKPGGRFLFTAPWQKFAWPDASTRRTSVSLGHDAYIAAIENAGLRLVAEHDDEGDNHYYDTDKP